MSPEELAELRRRAEQFKALGLALCSPCSPDTMLALLDRVEALGRALVLR